jgi:large subunit ribosomal protein L17
MKTKRMGRNTSSKIALLKSLATSLIKHERIETTETRAREIKPYVEKLVKLGKEDSLKSRRLARKKVMEDDAVYKLFNEIAPRCSQREGGYLRMYKTRIRRGDGTPMAIVEFVDRVAEDNE